MHSALNDTSRTDVKVNNRNLSLYNYDWSLLSKSKAQINGNNDDYCVGADQGLGECNWPATQQSGYVQMGFDAAIMGAFELNQRRRAKFSFVVTGDDDPDIDCYHERLEMDASIYYYTK